MELQKDNGRLSELFIDSVVELRVRKYEKAVAYIAARPSPNKADKADEADEADEADAN